MTPLYDAVYDRLAGSAALTDLLSTYKDDEGWDSPAIFMDTPVPRRAVRPWVATIGAIATDAFDTKDRNGMDLEVDFLAATDRVGSAAPVDAIAELVRSLLHRAYLDVAGYQVLIAKARPPIVAPSDETVTARIVHLRWVLRALT